MKLQRVRDLLVPVLENPLQAGELHWTGVKIHGYLKEQLGLEVGFSTTVRYLHELGYNLRVPRPWPERQNEKERNAFLEQLRRWQADPSVEIWFADECGVEGDPRPRRRWSTRGSRPTVPYLGDHIRANVLGAVCPSTGECSAMIFDGVDTDVFQYYLDHLATEIPPLESKRRLLIVDNASWHKANDSTGITSRFITCRATVPTSIPSNGFGYASKPTSSATSLLRAPKNLLSAFATP